MHDVQPQAISGEKSMHDPQREAFPGERGGAITPSSIETAFEAMARAGPELISLAEGAPPTDELPVEQIAAALDEALRGPGVFDYGAPRGDEALLDAIAAHGETLGVPPRRTVVCAGATQGIFLALYALGSPGDVVLTDETTYPDTLSACATLQLRVAGVEGDGAGMIPAALDETIGRTRRQGSRPCAVYLIPTAHNPTGLTMPESRRRELAAVACAHGVPIVEDDTYILFEPMPAPPLAALAPELVVRLDTLSKVLGPGLRVGWLSGPPALMEKIEQLKAAVDVCVPPAIQRAAAALLPQIRAHMAPQMAGLARRRAALLGALDEHFGARALWTQPRSGYFVWLTLDAGMSAADLFAQGLAEGVAVLPGPIFAPDGQANAARLSAARGTPAELAESVARLRRALDRLDTPLAAPA